MANTTIPSELIADGAITSAKLDTNIAVGGTLTVTGDANFDSNTLFVDASANNVGIGTSSPSYALDVNTVGHNSTGELLLSGGNSASNDYTQSTLLRLRATSINPNSPDHNSVNAAVAEIRFNHQNLAGNASSGNLTFYTNPSNNIAGALTERLRIQSGGGISFNGDTAAANALDDYEEGTWTPAIRAGGTLTISSINTATYTKIGRLVTVQAYIDLNDNGNGASSFIEGLPFNIIPTQYFTGVLTHSAGTNIADTMYVRPNGNTDELSIQRGKSTSVGQTEIDGGWIIFSVTYQTNE